MIELEAVHLGANDLIVHLLWDWPSRWIDHREARSVTSQVFVLRRHRRRRIVRDTIDNLRTLKRTPIGEQRHEVFVSRAARTRGARRGGRRLTARIRRRRRGARRLERDTRDDERDEE